MCHAPLGVPDIGLLAREVVLGLELEVVQEVQVVPHVVVLLRASGKKKEELRRKMG